MEYKDVIIPGLNSFLRGQFRLGLVKKINPDFGSSVKCLKAWLDCLPNKQRKKEKPNWNDSYKMHYLLLPCSYLF